MTRLQVVHTAGAIFFACSLWISNSWDRRKMRRWKISLSSLNSWPHLIFSKKNSYDYLAWLPRSASGIQHKDFALLCMMFYSKCSRELSFPPPISAGKYSAGDSCRIEIGCAFFVTFFAQAKKVTKENSRKKVMLRTFFHCPRTSHRTTGLNILDMKLLSFKMYAHVI